jgi:maltose alpha-D-glucosyltransferase/alpha-amylase
VINDLWYKNAVIYSLDLETFMDGNGDGHGDFDGLTRRLDYLQALGIDTLWLAPFQPSPNLDNGYDVFDFYGVDPRHGSSGDFVEFMCQANKRGMGVIIDLVVNHTSDQHPWFQRARRKDARYHDWYIWSKKRPPNWNEGMVFPGVQKSTWTLDAKAGEYYYHRFYKFQPDLNMANPEVRAEIRRIVGYWLRLGIAGFRVDAVPFILEASPLETGHREPRLRFEYLAEIRRFLQWRGGDAVLLGEANVLPKQNMKYFGDEGDGIHMMFNFFVNQHLFYTLASRDVRPLQRALRATMKIPSMSQWAHFLRNHDELDLGRLTQSQRQVVFDAFGPDPKMQIYERGIRRRLASMLADRRKIELAYSIMFSLPGAAVIRYGDEIGMGEDLSLPEREAVRTVMQWSAEQHAGFSTARKLFHPVISSGPYGCEHVNVDAQRRDPGSLLNWMAKMIRLRKECPEIGWGECNIIEAHNLAVLLLHFKWRDGELVTAHNFASEPQEVQFRIPQVKDTLLVDLLGMTDAVPQRGRYSITLDELGYRWYRLGHAGYGLRHSRGVPVDRRHGPRASRDSMTFWPAVCRRVACTWSVAALEPARRHWGCSSYRLEGISARRCSTSRCRKANRSSATSRDRIAGRSMGSMSMAWRSSSN